VQTRAEATAYAKARVGVDRVQQALRVGGAGGFSQ
jgi:hypothetical protein